MSTLALHAGTATGSYARAAHGLWTYGHYCGAGGSGYPIDKRARRRLPWLAPVCPVSHAQLLARRLSEECIADARHDDANSAQLGSARSPSSPATTPASLSANSNRAMHVKSRTWSGVARGGSTGTSISHLMHLATEAGNHFPLYPSRAGRPRPAFPRSAQIHARVQAQSRQRGKVHRFNRPNASTNAFSQRAGEVRRIGPS